MNYLVGGGLKRAVWYIVGAVVLWTAVVLHDTVLFIPFLGAAAVAFYKSWSAARRRR